MRADLFEGGLLPGEDLLVYNCADEQVAERCGIRKGAAGIHIQAEREARDAKHCSFESSANGTRIAQILRHIAAIVEAAEHQMRHALLADLEQAQGHAV